jgi:Flp pilus assembly pilin Flp
MSLLFLRAYLFVTERVPARRDERGQTTAEYALVLLGVAAVAGLLLAWANKSDAIGDLFDSVVAKIAP